MEKINMLNVANKELTSKEMSSILGGNNSSGVACQAKKCNGYNPKAMADETVAVLRSLNTIVVNY